MWFWQDSSASERKEQQTTKIPESKLSERLQVSVADVQWVLIMWLIVQKIIVIVVIMWTLAWLWWIVFL